ncbi:hypothetical protein [Metabacillus sp. FJAT-53654]|uniref:Phage metallopeptidase domain-containing protein n=1 Tax=Metabacillus rhizosphaerae TaxID=3117747 RepID=A0ABZ2MU29_9BACI
MQHRVIESVVNELLLRSCSLVKVKVESTFPDGRLVGGKYHLGTHTITLYIDEIKKQCEQLFSTNKYFIDYLSIVLAHEIGHAEDQQLGDLCDQLDECKTQSERDKIALIIEENAWRYAESLLAGINYSIFEEVIFHSLQPYREKIKMDIA